MPRTSFVDEPTKPHRMTRHRLSASRAIQSLFRGKHQPHRAAAVVFAVDGGPGKVILQGLLFAGSRADIDQITVRACTDSIAFHARSTFC